jgi:hypothetical protein
VLNLLARGSLKEVVTGTGNGKTGGTEDEAFVAAL